MNEPGLVTISMNELQRVKIIEAVTDGRLKPGQAAGRLGLSVRQVERLVLRYRAAGVAGLVSGKRGRPGNHHQIRNKRVLGVFSDCQSLLQLNASTCPFFRLRRTDSAQNNFLTSYA